MNPSTHNRSPLSPHRSFVVQFVDGLDRDQSDYAGRVEHIVSGESTHFASDIELLAFVDRVLTGLGADDRA